MAYYTSNFYDGEYHWPSYNNNYDVLPYHEPKLIEYYPTCDNGYSSSEIHYSMYYSSEPKRIQYETSEYFSSQTQYAISYSTSEFNEPEYLEYDPTPYGGGFNQIIRYGKPLPPSDEICYPRSTIASNDASTEGFSYASIPSPYGQVSTNDVPKTLAAEIKPTEVSEPTVPEMKPAEISEAEIENRPKNVSTMELIEYSNEGEEKEETNHDYAYDYPWSGYDYDCGNGRRGGCDYEYEYELEFCESLFGYWPCLSKKYPKIDAQLGVVEEENKRNPWEGTVDYLFGNSFMNEGVSSMGCSYYQKQPCWGQLEYYEENSWKQKFNIFEEK